MTPEHWQQVKRVFQSAIERPPDERATFLAQACLDDPRLRSEVESLVSSHDQAGDSLEAIAAELATGVIADDQANSIIGRQIGHYKVLSHIGRGGVGEVFLAQDTRLGRKAALKLLRTEYTKDEDRLRRFRQEARAASALNHPNILTIYDIGRADSLLFMATEYVEGETLRQHMARARMSLDRVLDFAVQAASALAAAHQAGITHRDVKPENIMLRTDGYVKVLDFGLAKLAEPRAGDTSSSTLPQVDTASGVLMGTVNYMSPEQARGLSVDTQTDIWSLGVVLFEMVAGCHPFEAATSSDVIALILQNEPPPLVQYSPGAPDELERIVRKALRKDKGERYQTAKDLLNDLGILRKTLELEAEMEHSAPPVSAGAVSSGQTTVTTARRKSTAEHIFTEIKKHKNAVVRTFIVLVIAAATGYLVFHGKPVTLTDKDTILLGDFVNTTGDDVLDGTLKTALAVQLEQSPFLNLFSDQRVRETLSYMGLSANRRVTKDVAREICLRQGLKAYLSGSISNLGSHLVITLEAVNAQTGDTIARQQVEAESKEQVLSALGNAATKLREKLGESLASIQKYNAPIQDVTTSSLEALKAASLGAELQAKGRMDEAIPFYKRAVELDPNFAIAYLALSLLYGQTGMGELAVEAEQKAMDLRERVSEREKLSIAARHYSDMTGELENGIEAFELLARTYPRESNYWNALGYGYLTMGQFEKAIESFRETIRLHPNGYPYWDLGLALTRLHRFDEAKEAFEEGLAHFDHPFHHNGLYFIGFIKGDAVAMQQQVDWASARPDQLHLIWQGNAAAFSGQLRKARELYSRGIEIEQRDNKNYANKVLAARDAAWIAFRDAVCGNCQHVKEDTARGLAIARLGALENSALALALCGETSRALSLIDEVAKESPKSTVFNAVYLPLARAAIEIGRNSPRRAIEFLEPARAYVGAGYNHNAPVSLLWPEYLRGVSFLNQKAGAQAAAEFQTILDHRGMIPIGFHYPLAHLGMARAAVLMGDRAKARKYYQDFFALWKEADADIPILIEANKEFKKLKILE